MTHTHPHANDNVPAPCPEDRPAWFDDLLMKYERLIRKICFRYSRSGDDAEDVYQQAVMLALANWHKYRPGPNKGFIKWVTFLVRDHVSRSHFVDGRLKLRIEEKTFVGIDRVHAPVQETLVEISYAIDRLPEREAKSLSLISLGYTSKESASMIGMSNQSVLTSAERARDVLRAANDNKPVRKAG